MGMRGLFVPLVAGMSLTLGLAACGGPGPGQGASTTATVYVFSGHDFATTQIATRRILLESEEELVNSAWLAYLEYAQPANNEFPIIHYYVPGHGFAGNSEYRVNHAWRAISLDAQFELRRASGPGETYSAIRIVRIESRDVIEGTDVAALRRQGPRLPLDLDVTNYAAVAEYYGLGE